MLDQPEDNSPTTSVGGAAAQTSSGSGGAAHASGGAGGTTHASGGSAGATHASGGSAGANSGGVGGMPSTIGGSGGGVANGCMYPSCVWNLLRDCYPDGQCTQESSSSSGLTYDVALCCSNGVNESIHLNVPLSGNMTGTVTITKHGQGCYSVVVSEPITSMTATYTYKDTSGTTVAKATTMSDGSTDIVCNDGESLTLPTYCNPDGSTSSMTTTTGTCPKTLL
jgi:hypothetical protein